MVPDDELAVAAAAAGAAVVRRRYGGSFARFDKSPGDFATDADIESERAIVNILREARPADGIVGEELGATALGSAGRTWLVDPLCGTANFAAQTPLMAVNVALQVGNDVAVAASADPLTDEVFWTDGERAFVRRAGADRALVPSSRSGLVDLNLDAPFLNADRFRAVRLLEDPEFVRVSRPRVLSTTLALAWVAAGRHAAYITDGDMRGNVHFSAGIALCRDAGCVVSGLRGEPWNTGAVGLVAAADDQTHELLIKLIDQQFRVV